MAAKKSTGGAAKKAKLRISIENSIEELQELAELLKKDPAALEMLEKDPEGFAQRYGINLHPKITVENLKRASSALKANFASEPMAVYIRYLVAASVRSVRVLFAAYGVPPDQEGK
jgi:hypothetical protein